MGGGGGTTRFGEVLTGELEVLAIRKGKRKRCPPFKRGMQTVLPCFEGGGGGGGRGTEHLRPTIFPFSTPPPSVINDRSLTPKSSKGAGSDVIG